jgi:hypothetical protein
MVEKIIYTLWRDADVERERFNDIVASQLAPALVAAGALALRFNIQDEHVAAGELRRQVATRPQMEAVIQLWVHSANDRFRIPLDGLVRAAVPHMAAYRILESTCIVNERHPPIPGKRTDGWSQIVFLSRPPRLTRAAWLDYWQGSHTDIGIDTQSNFEYVQNVITMPLTYAAPPYAAMVEECFPEGAMTDRRLFFDAVGDEAKFERNQRIMYDSCARFIDPGTVDCIATSQYVVKTL